MLTAPAALRRAVTVDSYGAEKFASILELAVVLTSFSEKTSFTPMGMPASGRFASVSGNDSETRLNASILGSRDFTRFAKASRTAAWEISPERIFSASSAMERVSTFMVV